MKTAIEIVNEIAYATLATVCPTGEPWNTPVFCAHDGFTLYWSSQPDSMHSKNIAANGQVFIVIYNSKAGQGEGMGVYMRAKAHALDDEQQIRRALSLLGARRGEPFKHIEKFMGDGPQRIYMAEPSEIWTNDALRDEDGDFISDYRTPVNGKTT